MIRSASRSASREALQNLAAAAAWTPFEIVGRFLDISADASPADSSGQLLGADGFADTLLDLSGSGNHLPAFDSSRRMVFDVLYTPADPEEPGPVGRPILTSVSKLHRIASLAGGSRTGFCFFFLGRWKSEGLATANRLWAGDNTPFCDWRTLSSAPSDGKIVTQIPAASGNSGNITGIPVDDWFLFGCECPSSGKGYWGVNDAVPSIMAGSPVGGFTLDAFALGGTFANSAHAKFDLLRIIFFEGNSISQDLWNKMRDWAAPIIGKTFSNSTQFLDTFSNAGLPAVRVSDSGHRYAETGTGSGYGLITGGGLTLQAPFGTVYWTPQCNFNPSEIRVNFTFLQINAEGDASTNAVGIGNRSTGYSHMLHWVFGPFGYFLEVYEVVGGSVVKTLLLERPSGSYEALSGTYKLERDLANHTLSVTDPTGTKLTTSFDSTFFDGTFFFEIIAGGDEKYLIRYDEVFAKG